MKYVGFNDNVHREQKILGTIVSFDDPKWSLITSHTSRRTFCTINIQRGYNIIDVQKASGHQTDIMFNKYFKYSADTSWIE